MLWVDRYGNCQLNVDPDEVADLGARIQLRWGDDVRTAERADHLPGIAPGEVGLVVDSYGLLSVCLGQAPGGRPSWRMPVGTEVTLVGAHGRRCRPCATP